MVGLLHAFFSNVPVLGYTVANVLLTLPGPVIVLIV
jgi:hypothetical protein